MGDGTARDFDVHGLVRVRLHDAPEALAGNVGRLLGIPASAPVGDADVTVRFPASLPPVGPLRFLGRRQAAFDDEHFYLLDDGGARMRVDLSRLGEPLELDCERTIAYLPLLVAILALRLAAKGYVLLHSASFVHRGAGVLVAGWQKGGKTETLLPFMADGAHFLADEWTIVGGAGPAIHGFSNVARLWDWQLRQYPEVWRTIPPRSQAKIRVWRAFERTHRVAAPALDRLPFVGRRLAGIASVGGTSWQGADALDPARTFGGRVHRGSARLGCVFLPVVGAEAAVRVVPTTGETVARRMVHSLTFERAELLHAVSQYRYAFPDRRTPAVEGIAAREEELLVAALRDVPAYELRHPYPMRLEELHRAAEPVLAALQQGGADEGTGVSPDGAPRPGR